MNNLNELNKIADWYNANKPNETSKVKVNMSVSELGKTLGLPYTKETKDFWYRGVIFVPSKR
jgi:hypothetical protein